MDNFEIFYAYLHYFCPGMVQHKCSFAFSNLVYIYYIMLTNHINFAKWKITEIDKSIIQIDGYIIANPHCYHSPDIQQSVLIKKEAIHYASKNKLYQILTRANDVY